MQLRCLGSWGAAAAAAFGFAIALGTAAPAAADPQVFGVSNSPVVNINAAGGMVLIKTWDRQAVQVESANPAEVKAFEPRAVARALGREIPVLASTIDTPQYGALTLPEETFVLSSMSDGPHDAVGVKVNGDATITIPQSTALVVARGHGLVTLDGYRAGTFFVRLQVGGVHLQNDGGEGFVQVMRGGIYANDSSFARLRARTAQGGMLFERCRARQIQATALTGAVVYDNGSFEPGLAHFESQYGQVAIGVAGGAEIGAHSGNGRIFTNFDRRAAVQSHPNDVTASVDGGGATVTASAGGAVLLYDGSVTSRTAAGLNPVWRTMREAFERIHARATTGQNAARATQPAMSAPASRGQHGGFPRPRRGHPPH